MKGLKKETQGAGFMHYGSRPPPLRALSRKNPSVCVAIQARAGGYFNLFRMLHSYENVFLYIKNLFYYYDLSKFTLLYCRCFM
jgi:hypothetical protein